MRRRWLLWVPLALFLVLMAVVGRGLYAPSDPNIHSQMVGQPLPAFALPPAVPGRPGLASTDLSGQPHLINIFASWCVPCAAEAPQLIELKRRGIPIAAIAIRDQPQDVQDFLQRWGDPYGPIGLDAENRVTLALGSSGVPETFIVDGHGIIRYQHIGAINAPELPDVIQAYEAAR